MAPVRRACDPTGPCRQARTLVLLALSASLACARLQAAPPGRLRVLTYNVHGLPSIVTGDDTLAGGSGADTLNGGEGMDFVDYSASASAASPEAAEHTTETADGGMPASSSARRIARPIAFDALPQVFEDLIAAKVTGRMVVDFSLR